MLSKIFTLAGSVPMIGFGIWHFFVPRIWSWYSYIKPEATELVAAVRAVNFFFSLSLVLIGAANIIFAFSGQRFALTVMLAISCILWAARIVMQLIFPQGSTNPALQYGMLAAFIIIFSFFAASLVLTAFHA